MGTKSGNRAKYVRRVLKFISERQTNEREMESEREAIVSTHHLTKMVDNDFGMGGNVTVIIILDSGKYEI